MTVATWSCWQVTVMHSMQAGYLEKAQKYTDKALMQLEKLKSKGLNGCVATVPPDGRLGLKNPEGPCLRGQGRATKAWA